MQYLRYKRKAVAIASEPISSGEELLDEDFVARLPELLELLNGKFRTKWEAVRTTFVLGEITSFAREIRKVGKEYHVAQLTEWSEILEDQALSFDMETLPGTLKQFDKIVVWLGNLLKK
jgi:hypothetical protein